ncbi:MAG: cyclic nucleotide-binding domain-containing protein [Mariprofundaceae bacterium]
MIESVSVSQPAKEVLIQSLIESNSMYKEFRALPLLQGMSNEHTMVLFSCMKEQRFLEGDEIYSAGSEAAGEMYLILDGKVSVQDEGGYQYTSLRRGDVFGLFSFLDDHRNHAATIRAKMDTVVLTLERCYFDLITLEDPKLGQHLMRFMFRLLSEKSLKMEVEYAHMHQFALGRKV